MSGKLDNPQQGPFRPLADVDPGRMAFSVMVQAAAVLPARVKQLVPTVTTFREWAALPGMDPSRVDEPVDDPPQDGRKLGDCYVYTHHEPGPGALHTFNFVEKRTDAQVRTPIAGLSYYTSDAHYWHDVIKKLWFVESRHELMQFIVNGARTSIRTVKARMQKIPGGNFSTLFIVEIFASHKPFPLEFFQLNVPVPSEIFWQVRNSSGGMTALHPYMEFAETEPDGNLLQGCGTTREAIVLGEPSVFPATNHTDWVNHVCVENVVQQQGVYFCERRTAIVPRGKKKLKNVAA